MRFVCLLLRLAGELVAGLELAEVAGGEDAEVGVGLAVLGLLEVVPPQVDAALDEGAGDVLPVAAGVLGAGDGGALLLADDGPPGLGHVDGLVAGEGLGLAEALVEALVRVLDAVGVVLLPEGVAVEAEPVDVVDDGPVVAVDERVVRVDVADLGALERGAADGVADLVDALDQVLGGGADLTGALAVQVLGTDGETDDEVGELVAVLADGLLESGNLVVDGLGAAGDPQTQKEGGLGVNGGGDGLDDIVGRVPLDHGVQAGAVPAAGAGQVLGAVELVGEIGLELGLLVHEEGAVVEALDVVGGDGLALDGDGGGLDLAGGRGAGDGAGGGRDARGSGGDGDLAAHGLGGAVGGNNGVVGDGGVAGAVGVSGDTGSVGRSCQGQDGGSETHIGDRYIIRWKTIVLVKITNDC